MLHPVSRFTPRLLRLAALAGTALVVATAVGCQGGPNGAYVGTWRAAGPDSLGMRYTFFADGTARIVARPPGAEPASYDARYTIVGDSMLTLRDQIDDAQFRVRLDGDTLHLENPASGRRNAWVRL